MKPLFRLSAASLLWLAACNPSSNQNAPANYLVGAWSWESQSFTSADTSYVWNDLAGQMTFTDKYYNLMWINRGTPRDTTGVNPLNSLTHEELKDLFNGVTSNGGSYQIEGDSIVMFRDVALYPNVMAAFNQPNRIPAPTVIKPDTLIWRADGFENVWVRRK